MLLLLNSSMLVGFLEYYILKRNFNQKILELTKTTKKPEDLIAILRQEVLPAKGHTTAIQWNDLGKQLVEIGAIDEEKYRELFTSKGNAADHMKYLSMSSKDFIKINEQNAHFMVNTLWALGLANKSKVLDAGPMKTGTTDTANFASTGGWTLGKKAPMELYSSYSIIQLTEEQEKIVEEIARNVYRPCCGNDTYFPDCNHGMAALAYIQLSVKKGLKPARIYKDLEAFNFYWFPQHYVELAAYFNKQARSIQKVNPKVVLSAQYSSSNASRAIKQAIQDLPGFQIQGGGCSA